MKPILIAVTLAVLIAALVWSFGPSASPDREAPSPIQAEPDGVLTASGSATGGANEPVRLRAGDASQTEDWRALIEAWLFDPARESDGRRLHAAGEQLHLSADACCRLVLDVLIDDVGVVAPKLCRDVPVSNLLRKNQRPSDDVVSRATRYKTTRVAQERHVALQILLADWPCFDEVSCRSTLMAAMHLLSDDALWHLLRQRLRADGPAGLAAVLAAAIGFADGEAPQVSRLALIMEAMFAFGGPHDEVMASVHRGMAELGAARLAAGDTARNEAASFGVFTASMLQWAVALRTFLRGDPSQPDGVASTERRALLLAMLDAPWPEDTVAVNAFHRLTMLVSGEVQDPRVVSYLKRVATHSTVTGVRTGALITLGLTQSIADIEKAFGEIVAADASAIRDTQLRNAFYVAVNNSRLLFPAGHADAARIFMECLAEQSADATSAQLFVLRALESDPMPELAWAVEQAAHQPGKPRVSEQASRTLQAMRRRR